MKNVRMGEINEASALDLKYCSFPGKAGFQKIFLDSVKRFCYLKALRPLNISLLAVSHETAELLYSGEKWGEETER